MATIKEIPLSGKLVTSEDSAIIGVGNFQTLQNMRYTKTHIKSIGGMTKINTTALSYPRIQNGYFFKKDHPSESHIVVQTLNSGQTASSIMDNTTEAPSTGDFGATSIMNKSNTAAAFFSDAPDGNMVMCDGNGAYVWSGDEQPVRAFIATNTVVGDDGVVTNPVDYTDNLADDNTDKVVALGTSGGFTKCLLHMDGGDGSASFSDDVTHALTDLVQFADTNPDTIIDPDGAFLTSGFEAGQSLATTDADNLGPFTIGTVTSTTITLDAGDSVVAKSVSTTLTGSRVITANGGMTQSDTQYKFGVSSAYCDGTNDFLSMLDSSDWDVSGDFTLDMWVWPDSSIGADTQLFSFGTGGTTDPNFGLESNLALHMYAGAEIINGTADLTANAWNHVAFVRSGSTVTAYLNGSSCGSGTYSTTINGGTVRIGAYSGGEYFKGYLDEIRWSNGIARWGANFVVPGSKYMDFQYGLIGSNRPLKGVKWYVKNGNQGASPAFTWFKEWNGASWTTLSVTDATTGLTTSGTVSWDSTVDTAKVKYINGVSAYWYQFLLAGSDVTIYYLTTNAPMQHVLDMYDGINTNIVLYYIYLINVFSKDETLEVLEAGDGLESDVSSFATTSHILCGFTEKMMGLNIKMEDPNFNTTASVMTVSYWAGDSYVAIQNKHDGTSLSGKSLGQNGVVSWTPLSDEVKNIVSNNTVPLYLYKISFSVQLSASTKIDFIGGIKAPADMTGEYRCAVKAGDSLWLAEKNVVIKSDPGTCDIWSDTEIEIGGDGNIVAGASLYSQLASNIYEIIIWFKISETYIVVPNTSGGYDLFNISDSIGCVAPSTVGVINVGLPDQAGKATSVKKAVIWQGANGIYISDGRPPVCISDDIENIFRSGLNTSKVGDSTGAVDVKNSEYHWFYASTGSSDIDSEMCFDLRRFKWFSVSRGTGKELQCAIPVKDTNGNDYIYGGLLSGYLERLDNGTDFDGDDIVSIFRTGDGPVGDSSLMKTSISNTMLTIKPKNITSNTIAMDYFRNAKTTADKSFTINPADSNHGIVDLPKRPGQSAGIFHSFKFSMTTDNESVGFEPLYFAISYEGVGEKTS